MNFLAFTFILLTPFALHALPMEPYYCEPTQFLKQEITSVVKKPYIYRMHAFKLGAATVVGMGVGLSSPSEIKKLAMQMTGKKSAELRAAGFCTWYFNVGNYEAYEDFNWHYLKKPSPDIPSALAVYSKALDTVFDQEKINFLECLTQNHYLALGCNSQKHRGPSVFAMLLAYSGCSPEHSTAIADQIWGLNGIAYNTRLALTQHAYALGLSHPESQIKMAQIFSAPLK